MLHRWEELRGSRAWLVPTSVTRHVHDARLKIKEPLEMDGLTYTEIAMKLAVGGSRTDTAA